MFEPLGVGSFSAGDAVSAASERRRTSPERVPPSRQVTCGFGIASERYGAGATRGLVDDAVSRVALENHPVGQGDQGNGKD
jgi:hypothetical protein